MTSLSHTVFYKCEARSLSAHTCVRVNARARLCVGGVEGEGRKGVDG